jgi:hypothetical protein
LSFAPQLLGASNTHFISLLISQGSNTFAVPKGIGAIEVTETDTLYTDSRPINAEISVSFLQYVKTLLLNTLQTSRNGL